MGCQFSRGNLSLHPGPQGPVTGQLQESTLRPQHLGRPQEDPWGRACTRAACVEGPVPAVGLLQVRAGALCPRDLQIGLCMLTFQRVSLLPCPCLPAPPALCLFRPMLIDMNKVYRLYQPGEP